MQFILFTCEGYRVVIELIEHQWYWRVEVFGLDENLIAHT